MKTIRISLVGTPSDYPGGLVPLMIRDLGYQIAWTRQASSDLQIFGPFYKPLEKRYRWLPRPIRPGAARLDDAFRKASGLKRHKPLSLFHTAENIRHDAIAADYSISFDLAVDHPRHIRFPYWMEMIDWSHEGLTGNRNSRFGQLLSIPRLMQPLGRAFLSRPFKAAIFSSHLREPRATLRRAVGRYIPVDGFGPYFDSTIADHHNSGVSKLDTLQNYAFNLCPENGLYPGYYTEKIPEAFASGCVPLTWTDANVCADFNPQALVNLEPLAWQQFEGLGDLLNSPSQLEALSEQALLLKAPTIEPLRAFMRTVLKDATT
jgi:hypothetical protein